MDKYEQYIKLLSEELNELAIIASIGGWKSKRVQQGIDLRKEIDFLKNKIKSEKNSAKERE